MHLSPDMPRGLRLTLIGSVVFHVGIVIALVVATTGTSHSSDRVETVITTRLVRLGKERPKELLPRKYRPPPPPSKKSVAIEGAKAEPAKPQPKRASDRINEMSKLNSAFDRLKKTSEEEPEGHEDGSVDGEVSDLAAAFIGNKYGNEIRKCVEQHYTIEGIPPGRVAGKTATVFVRLGADGSFADFKIEKGSGVKAADRAVERAVKRCGKVSPPPPEIRDQVIRDGIEVVFPMDPT